MPSTPVSSLSHSIASPPSAGSPSTPLAPGVQQRLLLKQTAIDTWSLKEQLGLASAVLRSGDQNWVSVSRQMKPFSEDGRPSDWFSQKNCALQYNLLLNKVDTPRRKRGEKSSVTESVETPGEAIVRKLTSERIKELRKVIEEETNQLIQLEDESRLLSDETIDESKLKEIELQIEKEEREEAERQASHEKWLREREEKKQAIQAALKAHSSKLPLKGAAAAAVLQAGAARRASTQSERSSFSDFDGSPSAAVNPGISMPLSLPVSATDELKKEHLDLQAVDAAAEEGEMSPVKSPVTNGQKGGDQDDANEKLEVDVATEEKILSENENMEVGGGETKETAKEDDSKVGTEALPEESSKERAEEMIKEEAVEESASEVTVAASTLTEQESANEEGNEEEEDEEENDDDEANEADDEVILKKEIDVDDSRKHQTKVRPSRSKKGSEFSEDDSNDFNNSLETSKSKLSKRSKKNSERSADGGDNTDNPTESQTNSQRATRHRSRKVSDNNGSTLASSETSASASETVENKRLSRVRETEGAGGVVGVSRGRRGSGTTASRSSSPVASGDESEVDQTLRGSRSRKKSGHKSTGPMSEEAESAPASPSLPEESSLDVSSSTGGISSSNASNAATEEWKKNALAVLTELRGHRWADKVMGVLQLGSKVYKRPIDLATIRKNVENGQLKNNIDLHHSLHHLFLNIIMSLNSESEVSSSSSHNRN